MATHDVSRCRNIPGLAEGMKTQDTWQTPDDELDELLEIALDLAQRAGDLLIEFRGETSLSVRHKTNQSDLVTAADEASERLIANELQDRRPRDGLVGEEGAGRDSMTGYTWIIDPLDGTTNYIHRSGPFGVSIGIESNGIGVIGVVYDPVAGELFSARAGRPAFCNGSRLQVSDASELRRSVVCVDGSADRHVRDQQAGIVSALLPRVRDIRRIGSAAIGLAWTAAARLDAFVCNGAGPWDLSAGVVIARQAGAWAGSLNSDEPALDYTIVTNDNLRPTILATLARTGVVR